MGEVEGLYTGQKMYFLASHTWKNWVASLRPTGHALTGAILYSVHLGHSIAPLDPQSIMLEVCSLRNIGKPTEIMMGLRTKVRTQWAYVHHGSWLVYGSDSSQDPGTGGH